MSAELFNNISIVAFVLAAIFFIIAVILFFVFDIPSVWGELSGKTAAKQVAEIRAANRNVTTRRRTTNASSSNNTAKVRQTGKLQTAQLSQPVSKPVTGTIQETELLQEETALLQNETELLQNETELLSPETTMLAEETTMLSPETTLLGGETTLLSPETTMLDEGTTLLSENKQITENFVMIQSIVVVHTNEKI